VAEVRAKLAPGTPIEVWFQDEMRIGQKNKLTYRWARIGSRPRAAHDQRTQSTYLFGAVCPAACEISDRPWRAQLRLQPPGLGVIRSAALSATSHVETCLGQQLPPRPVR
jgi:hypothetical protein